MQRPTEASRQRPIACLKVPRRPLPANHIVVQAAVDACGVRVPVAQGEVLRGGGVPEQEVHIVEAGIFEVYLDAGPAAVPVAEFLPGACFIADLDNLPGATCRAAIDGEVTELPMRLLRAMARRSADVQRWLDSGPIFDLGAFLATCYPERPGGPGNVLREWWRRNRKSATSDWAGGLLPIGPAEVVPFRPRGRLRRPATAPNGNTNRDMGDLE